MSAVKKKKKRANFLERYLYFCGNSEVPALYHTWSCLSIIAACLNDRVWYEKHAGRKLCANLYTILIGPSACGKGTAIEIAQGLLEGVPGVNMYRGKATGAHLADVFARIQKEMEEEGRGDDAPAVFLVLPELGMSVGEGSIARDFVMRITEQFTGGKYEWKEGTRTHGAISFKAPTINLLAGSTEDWLYESIPRSAIKSGFFGRAIPIKAVYDPNVRVPIPEVPQDYEAVGLWLRKRCEWMAQLEGRFEMTNQAKEAHHDWYMKRPAPSDETLLPAWKRADDLVLKLAMIIAVADGADNMLITSKHLNWAQSLVAQAHKDIPDLVAGASKGIAMSQGDAIAGYICAAGTIPHSVLLKRASNRGLKLREVLEHVEGLVQQGRVKVLPAPKGGKIYKWVSGHVLTGEEEGEEEGDEL